ncbi:LytR/AlgR family response regulator transcription factor [Gynurincola endophyticus]|uniref:LytR/AlgR family response regulator transcription factor n=1 Tax=Gynurincola endophyticus TaxID=2479004 RepID=UPI000F8F81DF|nr:LytTR family DNA-binding domain-containing protein [Gynurincola endophyticus]
MSYTVVIIEDEKPNADRLKRLLYEINPEVHILAVLESISESVNWFQCNKTPDLIMLDIQLSDGLSFEIFEKVTIQSPVVFTTAYDEYAIKAFKYNGIDYLLKPVELDDLRGAIGKLEYCCEAQEQPVSLAGLMDFFKPKDYRSRFLLSFKDGYKTLLVNDVLYFYVDLKITRARLLDGTEEIIPLTLEELEQQLDPKVFFRANRQFIVGINSIQHIHNYFNGKLKVSIKNDTSVEIIVSREKANQLKHWMDF